MITLDGFLGSAANQFPSSIKQPFCIKVTHSEWKKEKAGGQYNCKSQNYLVNSRWNSNSLRTLKSWRRKTYWCATVFMESTDSACKADDAVKKMPKEQAVKPETKFCCTSINLPSLYHTHQQPTDAEQMHLLKYWQKHHQNALAMTTRLSSSHYSLCTVLCTTAKNNLWQLFSMILETDTAHCFTLMYSECFTSNKSCWQKYTML